MKGSCAVDSCDWSVNDTIMGVLANFNYYFKVYFTQKYLAIAEILSMQNNCFPSKSHSPHWHILSIKCKCQIFCWINSTNFNKIKLAATLAQYISFMWLEDRGQILHWLLCSDVLISGQKLGTCCLRGINFCFSLRLSF